MSQTEQTLLVKANQEYRINVLKLSVFYSPHRDPWHVTQLSALSREKHLHHAIINMTSSSMSAVWPAMLSLAILLQTSIRSFQKELKVKLPAI